MKLQNQNKLVSAVLTLALGILTWIHNAGVLDIAITVIGIALVVYAVLDFIAKKIVVGVIKGVAAAGILVLGLGSFLKDIAIYVFGAFILVYGILQLASFFTSGGFKNRKILVTIFALIEPVVSVVAGLGIIFSTAATLFWIFRVVAILLIVDAVLALIQCITDR